MKVDWNDIVNIKVFKSILGIPISEHKDKAILYKTEKCIQKSEQQTYFFIKSEEKEGLLADKIWMNT